MTETKRVGIALLATGLMIGGFSTGCGSDACLDADEKLESECGYDLGEAKDAQSCTGEAECKAECVLDSCGCEDLEGTVGEASESCMNCFLRCTAEN